LQATPAAPTSALIPKLARPTTAYKLRAWLAMAGLALFMVLYFALAAWFALTAYRLTFGAGTGTKDAFWGWIVGACAAFLSVFMLKSLLFVKHGGDDQSIEITPQQQPELFRFLHRLADKAGAPRPHKVFVSARVNAAVFYDLSILNLILPSRKNLEIGLGLVNSLSLGELRAVLAHEFGHFAQRAMAVGRWVYIAQQIAAHLVARRDKLDDFLNALSRWDFRIAWVGWVLRLIVWSIRSLVDSAFQLVLLMQRALSREMEFNADLVAVSLTGSDALIHALYKLEAADDAWGRALGFVMGEKGKGRLVRDLFEIQSQVFAHMGQLLGDPVYGRVPAPAAGAAGPAEHRVFKAELAQPPQMWLSHPLNHEREANAKRRYIAAPIDERAAWALFDQPQALREAVTAKLLGAAPDGATPHDDALGALGRQFEREFFKSRYRGIYFGRSIVRCATEPAALYADAAAASASSLAALYPESLAAEMDRLRALEKEKAQLDGLMRGTVHPPGGVIRHRGKVLKRSGLKLAALQVERDLAKVRELLQAHDQQCRSQHLAAAAALGAGWPEYLRGLLAALHFADHTEDDLRDLQGLLANTVNIATATRKVNKKGIARIVRDGNALRDALGKVFDAAAGVHLDETLLQRLGVPGWAAMLGELKLPGVAAENVGDWLNAVDSWVDHTAGACSALRTHALELLLVSEATVAQCARTGTPADAAPAASIVPAGYALLRPGAERKRQTQLDGWGRFQTADGVLPAAARFVVAGGIVAAVLGLGGTVGQASVTVYNGLARPVTVQLGKTMRFNVPPHGSSTQPIDADAHVRIETRSAEGALIEGFEADAQGSFGQFVYNVAAATPLVEWTAAYGNASAAPERLLGAPRWSSTSADHVFSDAPKSISTKGGGGTRKVLSALGDTSPSQQLGMLPDPAEGQRLASAHARWDALASPHLAEWMWVAKTGPGFKPLLKARLAESPDDVLLLRIEQDSADAAEHTEVCRRDQARAAASPKSADLQYVAVRCLPEGAEKDRAFAEGHARHPDHGWYAYAASYVAAARAQWPQAIAAADLARRKLPALGNELGVDIVRMRRLLGQVDPSELADLAKGSDALRQMLALESGQGIDAPAYKAYSELARGHVDNAVQLAHSRPQSEARMVRLAGASDRAGAALIARALALPADEGLDESSVWAAIALAARAGRDVAVFEPALARVAPQQPGVLLRFVNALQRAEPPEQAERLLEGLTPELRGHGYSIGTVMLGARAPQAWRDGARRLLFGSERPYFD
jgi:Zn-dependent protease with chaperone function